MAMRQKTNERQADPPKARERETTLSHNSSKDLAQRVAAIENLPTIKRAIRRVEIEAEMAENGGDASEQGDRLGDGDGDGDGDSQGE